MTEATTKETEAKQAKDKQPEEQAGAKAALEAEYGDIDRSFSDGVEIEPEVEGKPEAKKTSTTVKKES
jgi:hypothetical protein